MKNFSLQVKFILLIIVCCSTVGFGASYLAHNSIKKELQAELEKKGELVGITLADHAITHLSYGESLALQDLLNETVSQTESLDYLYIYSPQQGVISHTFPQGFPVDLLKFNTFQEETREPRIRRYKSQGNYYTEIQVTMIEGLPYIIHLGLNETSVQIAADKLRNTILTVTGLICLIAMIFSLFTVFILTSPLNKLTKLIRDYGSGKDIDIPAVIELGRSVETISIAHSFAEMVMTRQQLEKKLRDSEERYALAFKGSTDGIWDWKDISKDECWWSPRTYELLGYEPGEFPALISTWQELMHPEDKKNVLQILQSHFEKHTPYNAEFRMKTKDRQYHWFKARGQATWDTNGDPTRMTGALQDIHDRKIAELKLATNELKFRNLLESTKSIPWEMDFATREFTYFGPQAESVFGFPRSYWKDLNSWAEFVHPEDREEAVNYCLNVSKQGKDHDFIYRAIDSGGNIRWIHDIVSVIMGPEEPEKLIGFLVDITERKKVERALQQSEIEWSTAMDAYDDALYLLDLNRHVIRANKSFCRLTQTLPEEIIGKHIEEIVHPQGEPVPCPVCMAQEEKRDKVIIMEADHPDNPAGRPIEITVKIVKDHQDNPISIFMSLHDLTKQRQEEAEKGKLEEQLRQAQKMEAVGTLAGGIAHDFNNILGVILGYTEMVKEDVPSGSKIASDLDKVLVAGRRAKDLVKQILAFSRQSEIERIPVQLQSLVKEVLKMLRSSMPTTIEIHDDLDSKCGVVLADPTHVHQILMNLCTNANHAMEKSGGILKIELKNICFDKGDRQLAVNLKPGEYVELIVSDTGPGIDSEVIDKIFDPYFTTKEVGKGTGLGLSIIHGIITEYHGTITVESKPDKGSTFHVYFPVIDQEELVLVKEAEKIPQGKERILFIDDEELLAQMGQDMLERLGYSVTARRSSLEALATFQNNPDEFDVIITDQTMPGISGSDLARRMLQIKPDISIILCTGYSNLIDENSAKAFGIKEFALKPLTKEVISKLIRKVLDGNTHLS